MLTDGDPLQIRRLTPEGIGGVAVSLLTGSGAGEMFRRYYRGQLLPDVPNFGRLQLFNGLYEEVVVHYISEESIEIHSHGGTLIVKEIQKLFAAAYSDNKKPELPRAEMLWSMLPYAPTERTAKILLELFHRPELPLPPYFEHLIKPYKVVFAGAVNAGKSSLLNAILGFRRSITDSMPGTTRDIVSGQTAINGFPFVFYDTAGLRETAVNPIEKEGIKRTYRTAEEADLVVRVLDVTDNKRDIPVLSRSLTVYNKIDLLRSGMPPDAVAVSAVTGEGISEMLQKIFDTVFTP